MNCVEVEGLRIELDVVGDDIVSDVSFSIAGGELLGLVGESGSGKTTIGVALLGHTRRGARIAAGSVRIEGREILGLNETELAALRGHLVSYVPQDPSASLNPALRLGLQLEEALRVHGIGATKAERADRIARVISEVKLPDDPGFLRKYPHQLSGGQQQRVVIAMAFICRPKVIVLDEPTTGLDVTTQAHVLQTVRDLCRTHGVAALYVTHDLAVVANLADRVLVMYAGRTVEQGFRSQVFASAAHPYTRELLAATPDIRGRRHLAALPGRAPAPGTRPGGCSFHPRCPVKVERCQVTEPGPMIVHPGHSARCYRAEEVAARTTAGGFDLDGRARREGSIVLRVEDVRARYGRHDVLHGVSLELRERECLALVGESGSGKTTLARCIAGLHVDRSGGISYLGEELASAARNRPSRTRQAIQYVFQSPYNSLNPRKTVSQIIRAPMQHFFELGSAEIAVRVEEALERVALAPVMAERYPDQLSGGERQRVAIARALVCEPEVLVCDEITSALDVSVQAAIVDLLQRLQRQDGLSLLFVTHNLALVRSIADRVVVMNDGRLVEGGDADVVIDSPSDRYTRKLLADTPSLAFAGRDDGP